MRLLHDVSAVRAEFDDSSLVSCAGLVPVMRLAQDTGLHDLVGGAVRLAGSIGSNPAGEVASIVVGMIAGADSIGARPHEATRRPGEVPGTRHTWFLAALVVVSVA